MKDNITVAPAKDLFDFGKSAVLDNDVAVTRASSAARGEENGGFGGAGCRGVGASGTVCARNANVAFCDGDADFFFEVLGSRFRGNEADGKFGTDGDDSFASRLHDERAVLVVGDFEESFALR